MEKSDADVEYSLAGKGAMVLALLLVINAVNFIDRLLPFVLIDAIKSDLNLTDSQVALMAGLSFAVVYSFAALPLAFVADRWSPRGVLVITLSVWSAMTAVSGLAGNFYHLIAARMGVAASEAGATPAAHALISRVFPASKRGIALAIFSLGVPIGSMIGLVLGGWVSDVANWRVAFLIVGLPGLFLAAISWFLLPKLPRLKAKAIASQSGIGASVRYLFARASFRHMAAGGSLYACGSYAMNVFAVAFLIRIHGLSTAEAGLGFGLAFGLGGLAGTFLGGWLSDRLSKRDIAWYQFVPAIGQLLAFPVTMAAWLVGDPLVVVLLLTLSYFFGLFYFAPSFAVAQHLARPDMRAIASALLAFFITLIGASVGPMAAGWLSDHWQATVGVEGIRYALCIVTFSFLWSAWHFYRAGRALRRDLMSSRGAEEGLVAVGAH